MLSSRLDQARGVLTGFDGFGLVIFGDTPMATTQGMQSMLQAAYDDAAAVVLGAFEREDGSGYGRVVLDAAGAPTKIVEQKDASPTGIEHHDPERWLHAGKTAVALVIVGSD